MGLFGKNAQQKRIDDLAAENAQLRLDVADLTKALATEHATCDALDRTAKKYRTERDSYREDALKHRRSMAPLTAANAARKAAAAR